MTAAPGFEYTSSLYVGRNGGGYLVREWLAAKDIAAAAAINLVRFMKTLRDAGRKVNPRFRTLIRLEPFWEEHDHIWKQLERRSRCRSVVAPDQGMGPGLQASRSMKKSRRSMARRSTVPSSRRNATDHWTISSKKGASADIYFVPGILGNHEPLIGIPFPGLIHRKLSEMADRKVETAAYQGGVTPPSFAPYNINQEVMRAFQFDRKHGPQGFRSFEGGRMDRRRTGG